MNFLQGRVAFYDYFVVIEFVDLGKVSHLVSLLFLNGFLSQFFAALAIVILASL